MTARPWMPFYFGDYLADTGHLTTLEHGAYLLLIAHYWQKHGLPDDDAQLARIARLTVAQWNRVKPVLIAFFSDGWKHKRIEFELTEAARISEAGRKGGKASAISRSKSKSLNNQEASSTNVERPLNDHRNDQPTIGQALQPQSQPQNKKEVALRAPVDRSDWPADAFDQFWRKFPHKVGKQAAVKAFQKTRRGADPPAWQKLITALDRYIGSKPPDRAWCNPATWLNEGRWDDEPAANGGVDGYRGSRPLQDPEKSISAAAGRLAEQAERGEFSFGPRPSLLPDADENAVLLLPQGRSSRS